jgi:biopolymer transport protein ExbD
MIDVLLVILIFLMITTTYNRYAGLRVNLPEGVAGERALPPASSVIEVVVEASGRTLIDQQLIASPSFSSIQEALQRAAHGEKDVPVVISADAQATHGSVVQVMEAAQGAGFHRLTVLTRVPVR